MESAYFFLRKDATIPLYHVHSYRQLNEQSTNSATTQVFRQFSKRNAFEQRCSVISHLRMDCHRYSLVIRCRLLSCFAVHVWANKCNGIVERMRENVESTEKQRPHKPTNLIKCGMAVESVTHAILLLRFVLYIVHFHFWPEKRVRGRGRNNAYTTNIHLPSK